MVISSLIQASVLYLPGRLAVAGIFTLELARKSLWHRIAIQTILSLVLGLVFNAWGAFILGSLGAWNGVNSLIFPWIPALLLWAFARRPALGPLREFMAGWGVAGVFFVLVQWVPARSEWVVGGWDPGVYTNEALKLVRTGSLRGEEHPFAQALGKDALPPVIRSFGTHAELFPGVPIDPCTGTVIPSFPRMSVAFFASVGRWMGSEGVLKAPLIFALLVLLLFMAWASLADGVPYQSLAVLILTAGQPIFIHYALTPSSEMIELLLLTACLGALWLGSTSRQGGVLVMILGMTLAANRTSFLLFGSLGMVAITLGDWMQPKRRQVLIRHGAIGVTLWGGHFLLGIVTPVAMYKLAHVLPRIYVTSLILMGIALFLDLLASWNEIREWGGRVAMRVGRWILPAFWVFLLALAVGGRFFGFELAQNFRVWMAYAGVLGVAAAAGGSVGSSLRRFPAVGILLLFLGASLAIVLWQKHSAELYPWALKRFLPWGIPFVVLGALFFCVDWARRLGREWLVWVLALILVAPAGRVALQAWKGSEYVGANKILQLVSGQVSANAWVICDHFQWATPLWLGFGIPAVDGQRLLANIETPQTVRFWRRTADLQRQGRRIYLLSSSDSSGDPWAATPGQHRLIWHSVPMRFSEIHQHSTNRDFPIRTISHEFKLYEWAP